MENFISEFDEATLRLATEVSSLEFNVTNQP